MAEPGGLGCPQFSTYTHQRELFICACLCTSVSKCDPSFFPAPSARGHSLNSCSGNPEGRIANKPEKSQTVAAVCLCPRGEAAEMRQLPESQLHVGPD